MRLFLALEIPDRVRREIASVISPLASTPPPQGLPPARWVRPEAMHLTLLFLGATPPDRVPAIEQAASRVSGRCAPFRLRVKGGGTFPPKRPGRVAWVGIEAPAGLGSLQAAIAEEVGRAAGLKGGDSRPFRPHLTVARARKPWPFAAARRFAEAVDRAFGAPFEIGETVLFESRLGREGATYRDLRRFPLARSAARGEPASSDRPSPPEVVA